MRDSGIRYEHGAWSLLRLDKSFRYVWKSLHHRTKPNDDHAYGRPDSLPPQNGAARVRLAAVGDVMWMHNAPTQWCSAQVSEALGYGEAIFANLETMISPAHPVGKRRATYNAAKSYLNAWPHPGRSVFSLVNNHSLDCHAEGLDATRETVRNQGARTVGAISDAQHSECFSAGGVTIGTFATTFGVNQFHNPDLSSAPGIHVDRFGDAQHVPDFARLERRIAALRAQGAELIVWLAHWGYEYEYFPDALQRQHAQQVIDLGVDVIIGSSPHVLQPIEVVTTRRNGQPSQAVIAYSLGNFASLIPTVACRVGGVLQCELERHNQGWSVLDVYVVPTITRDSGVVETLTAEDQPAHEHSASILGWAKKEVTC